MRLETISYELVQCGPRYRGILINEGDGGIIDMHGNKVEQTWDYRPDHEYVITIPDPDAELV